jgi:hypothetical protein
MGNRRMLVFSVAGMQSKRAAVKESREVIGWSKAKSNVK